MNHLSLHDIVLETERLRLRPFADPDLDVAVPFYHDPEFLNAMEGDPPEEPVTREYLWDIAKVMARQGYLFAIVEKATGRTIGEVCLQWMSLERGKIEGEKAMRLPIGIWDKTLWGKGYGKEVVMCLMTYAFEEFKIDRFCPVDVSAENERSKRLWESCGLTGVREVDNGKTLDYEITRETFKKNCL